VQMVRPAFTSCGNLNSISFVIQVPQRDMGCMLLQSTVMASLRRRLRRTTSSGRRRTCYTRVKTSAGPLKGSSPPLQHTAGSASSQFIVGQNQDGMGPDAPVIQSAYCSELLAGLPLTVGYY
jgi:hypothetical protein